MYNTTLTHAQLRSSATYYARSCDFMCLFDADSFDEEVETDLYWQGFIRDESGMLQLVAEYIYSADGDSGHAWDSY